MRYRSVWFFRSPTSCARNHSRPTAPHIEHLPQQPRYPRTRRGTKTKRKPAEDCWSPAGWFFVVYLTIWKRSPSSVIIPRVLPLSHLMWTVPKSSTVVTTPSSPNINLVYGSDDRKKRTRFPMSSFFLVAVSMFSFLMVERQVSSRDRTPCLLCLIRITHLRHFLLCPLKDTKLFRLTKPNNLGFRFCANLLCSFLLLSSDEYQRLLRR